MTHKPINRREFEAEIISRSWKDEKFRKELAANPKVIFERELGARLPADLQITVLQEDAKHAYLVVASDPRKIASEITDEQLNAVAGGTAMYLFIGPVPAR